MTEELTLSQRAALQMPRDDLAVPLLYLSSAAAGWQVLVAEAFYEPRELEG